MVRNSLLPVRVVSERLLPLAKQSTQVATSVYAKSGWSKAFPSGELSLPSAALRVFIGRVESDRFTTKYTVRQLYLIAKGLGCSSEEFFSSAGRSPLRKRGVNGAQFIVAGGALTGKLTLRHVRHLGHQGCPSALFLSAGDPRTSRINLKFRVTFYGTYMGGCSHSGAICCRESLFGCLCARSQQDGGDARTNRSRIIPY